MAGHAHQPIVQLPPKHPECASHIHHTCPDFNLPTSTHNKLLLAYPSLLPLEALSVCPFNSPCPFPSNLHNHTSVLPLPLCLHGGAAL